MTDHQDAAQDRSDFLRVDAGDFARFLEAKIGTEDCCPLCNGEDWDIFCPGGPNSPTLRMGLLVRNADPQYYASTFAYACKNCGFMRFHNAFLVHKWVSDNPAFDADLAGTGAHEGQAPNE